MADLLFLALTVVAFIGASGLVSACDRIIGPDGDVGVDPKADSPMSAEAPS